MILELGPAASNARVLDLAARTADILKQAGAAILHENSNIVAAHWPDRDVSALGKAACGAQRILVAARHGNLRVSPTFITTNPIWRCWQSGSVKRLLVPGSTLFFHFNSETFSFRLNIGGQIGRYVARVLLADTDLTSRLALKTLLVDGRICG